MKKRIFGFVLAWILIFMLFACNSAGSAISFDTSHVNYPLRRDIVDSPTRVLYLENGWLRYYNKLDGGTYPFCFDSLCNHDYFEGFCTSNLFVGGSMAGNLAYSAYDNRFYFLRGHKFCSMSFDGSDVRIEHSFGETGNPYEMDYELGVLADISSCQNLIQDIII